MMKRINFLPLAILLMFANPVSAIADCPETPNGTHRYLGVDVKITTNIVYPDIPELDLLRVQVVWVPNDPETRYRDQYLIDIDWVAQTHTNVDVWDGELQQITRRDLYPVILQTNTDFEAGHVHIESCAIYDSAGPVLMFAHYGLDGVIFPEYTMVTPMVGLEAVTNATVSAAIADTFNNGLDRHMIEDVELSTGVKPGHYLAQSFLFQNLEPSVHFLYQNRSLFFDAKQATVMQNRVYVTGDGASALVPLSMEAVLSDGMNIMDPDLRVRNLEEYTGLVQFKSRFRDIPWAFNQVFEARPDVTISTEECVDGASTITVDFKYPSTHTRGEILLYLGDSPAAMTRGPSLNEWISCEYDYRVEGKRFFEGESVSTGEILVKVATAGD
jgi:hypothetical protein